MIYRLLPILLLLAPLSGFSAVDMFLKIEGIKGESQDKAHVGDVDVLAWSWGMSNSSTFEGGSASVGRPYFQDIAITKFVDKATPQLMLNCANGKEIGKMELCVRKAGDTPLEYIVITFERVLVTSVSTGGSGGEDRLTENVTFTFGKITFKYVPQKQDGSSDTAVEFKWDVVKNTPF
jgi:type VI secretion system secreted protein Hcp